MTTHPMPNTSAICDDENAVYFADETFDVVSAVSVTCRPMFSVVNATESANTAAGDVEESLDVDLHLWALVLFLFPALTVFGNVLVVLSVFRERNLRTATNYFIVSLAVADIMVAILVMPLAVYVEVNNSSWKLGDVLCDAWVACDVMCCTASILNLTAISVDRFIAVTRPLSYARHKNSRRVYVMLAMTWVVSVAVSSPIAFGANYTERRHQHPDICTFYNADFLIYSSMTSFYVPCIAMIALYWRVFRAIRRRERKMAAATAVLSSLPANITRSTSVPLICCRSVQRQNDGFDQSCGGSSVDQVDAAEYLSPSALHLTPPPPPLQRAAANRVVHNGCGSQNEVRLDEMCLCTVSAGVRIGDRQSTANAAECGRSSVIAHVDTGQAPEHEAPPALMVVTPSESNRTVGVLRMPNIHSVTQTSSSMHSLALLISRSSTLDDDSIVGNRTNFGCEIARSVSGRGDVHRRTQFMRNKIGSTGRSLSKSTSDDGDSLTTHLPQHIHHQLRHQTSLANSAAAMTNAAKCNDTDGSAAVSRQNLARKARRDKTASRREKKATKTLAIVLGVFLLCWVPFFTLNIINAICLRYDMFEMIAVCQIDLSLLSLFVWLGYINSFLNPLIYTIFNSFLNPLIYTIFNSFLNPLIYTIFNIEFRRAFKRLLCRSCS